LTLSTFIKNANVKVDMCVGSEDENTRVFLTKNNVEVDHTLEQHWLSNWYLHILK
jgi:hypothetical protein